MAQGKDEFDEAEEVETEVAVQQYVAPAPQDIVTYSMNEIQQFEDPVTRRNLQLAGMLIKSNALPANVRNEATAFAIICMAQSLAIPEMVALNNIIMIEGKLGMTASLQSSQMRRFGVKWKVKYDGHYLYANGEYHYDRVKNDVPEIDPATKKPLAEPALDGNNKPYGVPVNRITTLVVLRDDIEQEISYTWQDAKKQMLVKKRNWVRTPREMMMARCLTKVRTQIAPDSCLNMYSADELLDSLNTSAELVEDDKASANN